MKALKIFGVIVGLLLIVSLILPRTINMEKSVMINGKVENVFDQINIPTNWIGWSAWDQIDPEMKSTFSGPESGAGAAHAWESEHPDVGNGSMTIVESIPNERIKIEFDFLENGTASAEYTFEETDEGIKLVSVFICELPPIMGPWIRMMMMGPLELNTQQSLDALKEVVEKMPQEPTIEVTAKMIESQPVDTIIDSTDAAGEPEN